MGASKYFNGVGGGRGLNVNVAPLSVAESGSQCIIFGSILNTTAELAAF